MQNFRTADALSAHELTSLRLCRRDNVLIGYGDSPSERLLTLRPLSLAPAVQVDLRPAMDWAREQRDDVESLILFGSQARGTAHENSDIDFYVVGHASKDSTSTLADRYPGRPVDVIASTRLTFDNVLSFWEKRFETVVFNTGVLVTGRSIERRVNMNANQRINLKAVLNHFDSACRLFQTAVSGMDNAVAQRERGMSVGLQHLVAATADCGERTAKAMLELAGLTPVKTHAVSELADQLRADAHLRQGFETLRDLSPSDVVADRISAMDGETATDRLHVATYREIDVFPDEPDGRRLTNHAHARLGVTIDNLLWVLGLFDADDGFSARYAVEIRNALLLAFDGLKLPVDAGFQHTRGAVKKVQERVRRYERAFDVPPWPSELFERVAVALVHPTPKGPG